MANHDPIKNQKWRLGVLWQRRYLELGEEGPIDRSRLPIHSPRATKPKILAKIISLRRTYHFGPWKIMIYLERYHDIHVSSSGIWRILNKLQMSRLPVNQRYKRHVVGGQIGWTSFGVRLPVVQGLR